MLGSSNPALLTFSGGTRPKCVYCMGVERWCTEYKPTIQMCLECMQEGHRSDVCPNPKNISRGCGLENPPPQGHECEVRHVQGGGARDASVPEQTDCRQTREDDSPVSIAGAVGTEHQESTGALVRVDGGGGPLPTHESRAKSNTPSRYFKGFAAVEFATA
ncbi:hypothetical protein HPB49_003283 [Dermacentor silvarum]|uniref:Uncharacterized protein n=1 Tax=Dermacentor silvarum TaxID=543639 RepID=A0ACB8DAQ3_DERSI|nr:hypothetical protein HPB49_003283 [Dermacentor silvarum]